MITQLIRTMLALQESEDLHPSLKEYINKFNGNLAELDNATSMSRQIAALVLTSWQEIHSDLLASVPRKS